MRLTECRDWSDEEILAWLKEHYPQFASPDFVEVGRRILKRVFCQDSGSGSGAVPIADLPKFSGQWVWLGDVVIVSQDGERSYVGCAVCGKKNCLKHADAGTVEYLIRDYTVADKTGETRASIVARRDSFPDVRVGQVVRLWGRVGEWKGRHELTVYDIDKIVLVKDVALEPPRQAPKQVRPIDDKVDKAIRAVRTAQASGSPMSRRQFESLCSKLGVSPEEVLKSGAVRVEGGNVVADQ